MKLRPVTVRLAASETSAHVARPAYPAAFPQVTPGKTALRTA